MNLMLYGIFAGLLLFTLFGLFTPFFLPAQGVARIRLSKTTILLLSVFVIGLAIVLYAYLGQANAYQQVIAQQEINARKTALLEELKTPEQVIAKLKQHLEKNPNSAEGWFLLGRLYFTQQKFTESATAFSHANELNPNQPAIMVQYAQALFFSQDKKLSPAANNILNGVLKLEPNNAMALNIIGIDAYNRQDYSHAISAWEKVAAHYSPDSEEGRVVREAIEDAKRKQR